MKFAAHTTVIAGVVMLTGSLFLTGGAMAYGQQWRPAPGYLPASVRPYQAATNLPAFRPAAMVRHQRYQAPPQAPSYSHPAQWQRPPVPVQRYAAMPPGPVYPVWGVPYGAMDPRGLQAQAPMFARQFAWRPANRPWLAPPHVAPRAYRHPVRPVPRAATYDAADPRLSAVAPGSWRPTAAYASAASPRHGFRPVRRFQDPRAATWSPRPQQWAAPPRPAARVYAARPPIDGRWRPQPGFQRPGWEPRLAFRPVGYGRSIAERRGGAPGDTGQPDFTRENLPGWVTTYQDTADSLACSWCSGS